MNKVNEKDKLGIEDTGLGKGIVNDIMVIPRNTNGTWILEVVHIYREAGEWERSWNGGLKAYFSPKLVLPHKISYSLPNDYSCNLWTIYLPNTVLDPLLGSSHVLLMENYILLEPDKVIWIFFNIFLLFSALYLYLIVGFF